MSLNDTGEIGGRQARVYSDPAWDDLRQALADLNRAAYAAIRAGADTTAYPMLNRQKLREIARLTDEIFEQPDVAE